MQIRDPLKVFGLSTKGKRVLRALMKGPATPLELARTTKLSRTTIYDVLANLKAQGIVTTTITQGTKRWHIEDTAHVDTLLAASKRALLHIPPGRSEISATTHTNIIVHSGRNALRKLITDMTHNTTHEPFYVLQGNEDDMGWGHIFTIDEIAALNETIKHNKLIMHTFLPDGWFERHFRMFGVTWAKSFEGRATRVHTLPQKYFKHGAQLFLSKKATYLFAFNEETGIEIRHSEIHALLYALVMFIQDTQKPTDANSTLRALITQQKTQ